MARIEEDGKGSCRGCNWGPLRASYTSYSYASLACKMSWTIEDGLLSDNQPWTVLWSVIGSAAFEDASAGCYWVLQKHVGNHVVLPGLNWSLEQNAEGDEYVTSCRGCACWQALVLRHPRLCGGRCFVAGRSFAGSCISALPVARVVANGNMYHPTAILSRSISVVETSSELQVMGKRKYGFKPKKEAGQCRLGGSPQLLRRATDQAH
eukprot:4245145-Amphidinium_carterae.1